MLKKHKWIAPVAFVLLVIVTVYVVASQSKTFTAEGFVEYVGAVEPWGLAVSVVCMLGYIAFEGMALLVLCHAMGYDSSFHRGVLYSAADIYFSAVTPSATGGQPASALLLMADEIPGAVTTVALLINLCMYNLALLGSALVGWLIWPGVLGVFDPLAHVLIGAGALLHLALVAGILLLVFSDRLFLRLVNLFLHLGQKLHLVKSAEARAERLLKIEDDYRVCSGGLMRSKGALTLALLYNLIQRVATSLVPVVIYAATGGSAPDLSRLFSIHVMAVLGSNSIPVPGAVGVADYLFLNGYGALMPDPTNLELLSRTITFYSCVLVCGILLLLSFFINNKKPRKREA